jgi:hypothetical protein
MDKQSTSAALERLEGVAAEFLEDKIADVDKAQHITIKDVEVAIVPDAGGHKPSVVTVIVST